MKLNPARIILLFIFISILFFIIFLTINKEKQIANVTKIIDGDTIEIETSEQIRLLGINAPEKGSNLYEKANSELKYLIINKSVILERVGQNKDRYGRFLRIVYVNNTNINLEMIRNGLALLYIIDSNFKYIKEFEDAFNYCIKENIGLCEKSNDICGNCIKILKINSIERNSLNDEFVEIKNLCDISCNISDWIIHDSAWNTFIFKNTIDQNTSLFLYSGMGNNKNNIFYWNSAFPIWNNQYDVGYIRDKSKNLVDYFIIK